MTVKLSTKIMFFEYVITVLYNCYEIHAVCLKLAINTLRTMRAIIFQY